MSFDNDLFLYFDNYIYLQNSENPPKKEENLQHVCSVYKERIMPKKAR